MAETITKQKTEEADSLIDSQKTFADFDLLNLSQFANDFFQFIQSDHKYVEGSFVLSLNGGFGTGKSCFLEMFKDQLEKNNQHVITVNAWKNDFFNDPLVAITAEIYAHAQTNNDGAKKVAKDLMAGLTAVVGGSLNIANQLTASISGINVAEAIDSGSKAGNKAKKKLYSDSEAGKEVFQQYEEKKQLFDRLNDALRQYVNAIDQPLIVLVDELDRARPDYAVQFLETLKHFFEVNGVVFVLAVDKDQLAASVRCLYGQEIDFAEYYRKFVHRNVQLPVPDSPAIARYIESKVQEHFDSDKKSRFFVMEMDYSRKEQICQLCRAFNLTPRQMDEMFRLLSYRLGTDEKRNGAFGHVLADIISIVISVSNDKMSAGIVNGECSYSSLLSLFQSYGLNDSWWGEKLLLLATTKDNFDKDIEIFANAYPYELSENDNAMELLKDHTKKVASSIFDPFYRLKSDENELTVAAKNINSCKLFFH